jgi:hypothetical protein
MDNKSKSSSSSGSGSKSKATRKNKSKSRTNTARAPIGKKETKSDLDDDLYEVVGSMTSRQPVARPQSIAPKTQRKQTPVYQQRVLVSSKIRKQGIFFKITREYSDGTKENENINTDENKPVTLVFQKQKELRSQQGWPGVEITKYFSDGRIEKTKDWKYNKERR